MKQFKYCAFLLMCYCSFSALAQETPGEIITDRPDETEAPSLVPRSYLQVETGYFYEETEDMDLQSRLNTFNTTLLRYGLLNNLELRLGFNLVRLEEEAAEMGIIQYETGLEPLLVGAKVGIAKEDGLLPQIGLLGHLYLPFAASKHYQPESTGVDFRFAFSHTLSSKADLAYNVGAKWGNDNSDATYIYTLAYGYGITEAVSLYAEIYGDFPEAGKAEHHWDAGATYLLADNFQLDAFVGTGIDSPQQLWIGGGFSFRIPN